MPHAIEKQQVAAVGHRLHFWGRPSSGDTVSWNYSTQPWLIDRPDDGAPPRESVVTCAHCGRQLTYTVHSVSAAAQRRTRWRPVWIGGFILAALGVVILFTADSEMLAYTSFMVGLLGAVMGLQAAGAEIGLTGHGVSWPGATKHNVMVD
jgi:hypothetical protein